MLADAKTEEDALKAILAWSRLKSVLVNPDKAGKSRRRYKKKQMRGLLKLWIAAKILYLFDDTFPNEPLLGV